MVKEKSKVEKLIESYHNLRKDTLSRFCEKQKLTVFRYLGYSNNEVICFSPELRMEFRDIFLDLSLHIESGIALRYMQGFDMDMDDAQIEKSLTYKDYLKSKKLI